MNSQSPEVEAKILGATESQMISVINTLGFVPYFKGNLKAQWLVNPLNKEKVRVRQEGDRVMVEHKAPAPGGSAEIKSMQETGFEAHDFDAVIATFTKLGLQEVGLPSVKRRISYILDEATENQVRLDFDTYSNLMGKEIPEFLEIEATSAKRVYEIAEALGFAKTDCRNFWVKELFAHYYPDEAHV